MNKACMKVDNMKLDKLTRNNGSLLMYKIRYHFIYHN